MATGKHTVAADGKPGLLPLGYLWVAIEGRATLWPALPLVRRRASAA